MSQIAYPGRKIGYMDEAAMRKAGYDKTPDIKLEVPFAVNNRVINWIESKALFGDEEVHADYLKNQVRTSSQTLESDGLDHT